MNERELFIAAIQLEGPCERAAYLEKVCQGDPEIKQRVEVLVEAFENAGSFLQANDAGWWKRGQESFVRSTRRAVPANDS